MTVRDPKPIVCPNCRAYVPPRATACPGCGSDESTGWSSAAGYAHTLPEQTPRPDRRWRRPVVGLVAITTVIALLAARDVAPLLLVVIALGLLGLLALGIRSTDSTHSNSGSGPRADLGGGFERLVRLCYNDRAMAERLVAAEERRTAGLGRTSATRRAIEGLIADRRR